MTRLALRGIAARKLRTALTAVAVVLGVAMVSGTFVLTDTIDRSFDEIFAEATQGTDVMVSASGADDFSQTAAPPVDDAIVDRIRRVDGVAAASGAVFGMVSIRDPDGERIGTIAPNFVDSIRGEPFDPYVFVDGAPPASDEEAALDERTASQHRFSVGDPVTIVGAEGAREYRVSGIARFGEVASLAGASLAVMTLPAAQRALGREGEVDEVSVAAQEGVPPGELRARVEAALEGERVNVRTGEQEAAHQAADFQEGFGFFRTALLVFGGIALFVGAFVIYNTFTITVAQRTRELGLLRTLGATRRQVLASVLLEALAVGLVAAAAGLAAGLAVAPGLTALFDALGIDMPVEDSVVLARTVAVALAVGVLVTLAASLVPALRATRIAPIVALREGLATRRSRGRLRFAAAAALGVAGVALILGGLLGDAPPGSAAGLMGVGAAVVFLAVALLTPWLVPPLAAAIGSPLQGLSGMTGRLARENATRNPARTAITAAALMVGVALVAFVSIFAAGLRGTIDRSIDERFTGELTILSQDGFAPLPSAVADEVAEIDGVRAAAAVRFAEGREVGADRTVTVAGIDAAAGPQAYDMQGAGAADLLERALGDDGALADAGAGVAEGRRPGDRVTLRTPAGREVTYTIRGLIDEGTFGLLGGGLVVPRERMAEDFGQREDALVLVAFEPGADPRPEIERLLAQRFPVAEALDRDELKDQQASQINQLLGLIYALLALSVIVSIFGIVNTLALSIHERTRELGLLRAIGTTRRQVRRMVRQESVITSLIGAVLGVALGVLFALLISRPLEEEGFTLSFPVVTLVAVLAGAAAVGTLAAVGPARRASRLDVLEALDYE